MTVARADPTLLHLLQRARAHGASDLHLRCGAPPWLRAQGVLVALDEPALTAAQMQSLLQAMRPASAHDERQEQDFAFALPALGRYRANVFLHAQGPAAVLRCIAEVAPALADLRVPDAVPALLQGSGLVLVTGPTGSGKSTTLAAMVQHLNQREALHILTLEDPIEFVHSSQRCLITQREIGTHSPSFASALRAALREDPDVLLVGELRDLETIRLALTAAETGHLVLASLHTRHAAATIERIVDVFEASEKALVRTQLADALRCVLSQTLVPRADGRGLQAAFELLVGTPAVRNLIREGKTAQLSSVMQTGAAHGMVTMAQALQRLQTVDLATAPPEPRPL